MHDAVAAGSRWTYLGVFDDNLVARRMYEDLGFDGARRAGAGPAAAVSPDLPAWPVVARIWQTVDVERTVAHLGLPAEPIADDEVLGARGVLVRPPAEPPLVIVEPSTEGRLAAALARHGEGDAGTYVAPAGRHGRRTRRGAPRSSGPVRARSVGRRSSRRPARTAGRRSSSSSRRHRLPSNDDRTPGRRRSARRPTPTPSAIAALLTDEGYPSGPSDIVERLGALRLGALAA